ncbi:MAG: insulinase family protein, partial [Thiogranum sp.]
DYIPGLVRNLLLENQHRVRLTMVPDTGLSERRDRAEAQRLARMKAQLSEREKQDIVRLARELAERQQQEDDPDVLPKVGLADVPAGLHIAEGEKDTVAGHAVSFYPQGTNGLVYQQLVVDLPRFDDALLDTLPYYSSALAQLGCGGRDYLATQALQTSVSGGVHASSSMRGGTEDVQALRGFFVLSGKALTRNHAALSSLLVDTLETPRFDELERIRELIAQQRAQREQSVTGNGHGLAMLAASSGHSAGAALSHRLRGLQGIHYLKALDDRFTAGDGLADFADSFASLHARIRSAPRQFLLIAEAERRAQAVQEMVQAWSQAAGADSSGFSAFAVPPVQRQVKEAWLTNTQVNFCARAFPTVPPEHADSAPLSVLAGFLRNGYLHRAIREQGGAYGGGASHDSDNASFRFFSYRDPRLEETLDDFDRSVSWLLEEKHEWRTVEEAILGVIGNIDKPGSPAGEAKDAFYSALYGRTPEQRQRFRQRVLEVSLQDLQRVGETYLKPEQASVVVISNQNAEQQCRDLGLEIKPL